DGLVLGEELAHPRAPPEVGDAGEGAAGGDRLVRSDPAPDRHAQPVHARRPLGAWVEVDPGAVEGGAGGAERVVVDLGVDPRAGAPVAPTAVLRARVVERALEEGHATAVGGDVVEHVLLLGLAGGGHPLVALGVVDPGLAGARPGTAGPPEPTVDVEHR